MASRLRLYQDGELHTAERETTADADTIEQTVSLVIERGGLVIEKLIALYTSRDPAISEPGEEAEQALQRIARLRQPPDTPRAPLEADLGHL